MKSGSRSRRRRPVGIRFEDGGPTVTASAGVVLVLDLLTEKQVLPQPSVVDRRQGWIEGQMHLTLILLNILGLDRVEDVEQLEADHGLCALVRRYEFGLFGVGRRWFERQFRGGRGRTFPSPRAMHDWLRRGHDAAAGRRREKEQAYIPRPSAALRAGEQVIGRLLEELAAHREVTHATLDLDATIVSSGKREALFTYRAATGAVPGERGYQPMVAYCPELGAVVHTEFRDGNVPASREKKRVVAEALLRLPPRIAKVTVRADTAGYQEELIRFCNDPEVRPESLRRFGVIRFVCGAPRTEALMEAGRELPESDWQAIAGGEGREYAEVPFVPNLAVRQPDRHTLRYLAVRRPLRGQLGIGENDLPAVPGRPAMRLRFLFTNIPDPEAVVEPRGAGPESLEGAEVVDLAYGRCGEGEEIHAILKSDFAGGMMPSGKFGANACWWQWAAVSHDVVALLRVCALGTDWLRVRMKRLRAKFFHLAARVVRRGRRVALVLPAPEREAFREALARLDALPIRC